MEINIFKKYKNIFLRISSKREGSMKIGLIKERKDFLSSINLKNVVSANLIHGKNVSLVSTKDSGRIIPKVDSLITSSKNLFLSITVADCLPIFLFNPKKETIALIHGGWKGINLNIIEQTVFKMDGNSKDMLVFIGPGISKCHFEIKEDVSLKFKDFPDCFYERNNKKFLDIKEVAKRKLINLGIKERNIEISKECTYCMKNKYFSYRRDGKGKVMIVIFGMTNKKCK